MRVVDTSMFFRIRDCVEFFLTKSGTNKEKLFSCVERLSPILENDFRDEEMRKLYKKIMLRLTTLPKGVEVHESLLKTHGYAYWAVAHMSARAISQCKKDLWNLFCLCEQNYYEEA